MLFYYMWAQFSTKISLFFGLSSLKSPLFQKTYIIYGLCYEDLGSFFALTAQRSWYIAPITAIKIAVENNIIDISNASEVSTPYIAKKAANVTSLTPRYADVNLCRYYSILKNSIPQLSRDEELSFFKLGFQLLHRCNFIVCIFTVL